jgi:hypothetical protein
MQKRGKNVEGKEIKIWVLKRGEVFYKMMFY